MTPSPTACGRNLEGMDNKREVQQFLTALRARLTPEQAGLTIFGGERRVPGLRREEVAQLAGVSTAYYTRMERGNLAGVSESVLYALARALHLDDVETTHLPQYPNWSHAWSRTRRWIGTLRKPPGTLRRTA